MQTGTHANGGTISGGSLPDPDQMARKADETTDRLADQAHETVDRISETVQPTVKALGEKASQAADRVTQRAGQLRESGETALENTRNYVRENPIAAIGIAAVAGLLLGRMRH